VERVAVGGGDSAREVLVDLVYRRANRARVDGVTAQVLLEQPPCLRRSGGRVTGVDEPVHGIPLE
jgi:hypothetical protein